MKKIVALLLCMATCVSMLVGCGGKDKDQNANADWDGKITIGIPDNASVQDYETNKLTLWLEEQTGYDIEFYVFAGTAADSKSQLATMVAGGEKLPDVIMGLSLGDEEIKDYGDDGYFIDLKPLLDDKEKSAKYWELVETAIPNKEEREFLIQQGTDPENGAIYGLPTMEVSMIDTIDSQVYINKVWLDKLGLPMPTDNESLRTTLEAFVTKDPNGNGKKDEVGLVGRPYGTFGHSATSWIINNFCLMSTEQWFNVDSKGKLYLPFTTDEYREALIYMNEMTASGALTKSIWTMTPNDTKNFLNPSDGVNKVGIFVGHPSVVLMEGFTNQYDYVPLPYWGYAMENSQKISRSIYITEDCDNVDAVWDLLMTMTTKEASYRFRYGEYGVDWEYADEGTKSFMGLDAEIKVLNEETWSTMNNQTWHTTVGTIMANSENEVTQMPDEASEWALNKYSLMKGTYDNFQKALKEKPYTQMPILIYTSEERLETEAEVANCKAWIETMRAQFVCGTDGWDPSNDAQWKEYLDELNKLGVNTWLEQAQKIYDRQTK